MPLEETIENEKQFSLADVAERLSEMPELEASRRRDLISSVNTLSRMLHRNAEELPADLNQLRKRLDSVHPVQAGISRKRLSNIKSDLKAAVQLTLPTVTNKPQRQKLMLDWAVFLESLEQPWYRHSLSRLARFCSREHVAPTQLSDAVLATFHRHLVDTQLCKDPDEVLKITRQTWNGIAAKRQGELPAVSSPPLARFITRPLTDYPQSLQDDLEVWLRRQSSASMFDEEAPPRALRPTSIRNIRANIRQFAHALVETGIKPEQLTSLADLVNLTTYRAGLQQLVGRNGDKPAPGHALMAGHLVAIAKYHVKMAAADLDRLRTIKSKLVVTREGLTEKNKARLRQFSDDRNIDRLVCLPGNLFRKARAKKKPSTRDALAVMYAVATDILLACPMRIGNVAGLDIEKHLRWYRQGRGEKLTLAIPGTEVKNGQPIEVDLPLETAKLLKAYLADWRPLLTSKPSSNALFPMRCGKPRRPTHVSQGMKEIIYRETGIEMNAHLFRHMAGKLYLDEHPGEYETVRRLLGHRKLTTTTSFYAPLENARAHRQYDEVVLSKRRSRS